MSVTEQRLAGLALANQVRIDRARWYEQARLEVVPEMARDQILDPEAFMARVAVSDMLRRAVPQFGPVKVGKILKAAGVNPLAQLGALTERQREAIVEQLPS